MDPDYYAVLGVAPTADADAVKRAYRQRAMECHPDRGGSHEAMVRLNEAWGVLSDPDARARYDAARAAGSGLLARASADADAREARQRAATYPRRWEDFERWLDGLARDFAAAQYGSSTPSPIGGLRFPTADGSVSGWVFIVAGALLGALVSYGVLPDLLKPNVKPNVTEAEAKKSHDALPFILIGGGFVGAWVGVFAHQLIAEQIKSRAGAAPSEVPSADPGVPDGPSYYRLLVCGKCGQKLRVPGGVAVGRVTCRACGHQFPCPPE